MDVSVVSLVVIIVHLYYNLRYNPSALFIRSGFQVFYVIRPAMN